jgi:hypothetical protein
MINNVKKNIIAKIEEYLKGDLNDKEISDWAQDIVISKEFDLYPEKIKDTILILFDLHDAGCHWCYTKEQIRSLKNELEKLRA